MKLRHLGAAIVLGFSLAAVAPLAVPPAAAQQTFGPSLTSLLVEHAAGNAAIYVPSGGEIVQFHNGSGAVPGDDGFSSRITHVWDIQGSTVNEVMLEIVTTSPGTGTQWFVDLVVAKIENNRVVFGGHHSLPMKVIQGVKMDGGGYYVTYLSNGPNDARCCPTQVKNVRLFSNGSQVLMPDPSTAP